MLRITGFLRHILIFLFLVIPYIQGEFKIENQIDKSQGKHHALQLGSGMEVRLQTRCLNSGGQLEKLCTIYLMDGSNYAKFMSDESFQYFGDGLSSKHTDYFDSSWFTLPENSLSENEIRVHNNSIIQMQRNRKNGNHDINFDDDHENKYKVYHNIKERQQTEDSTPAFYFVLMNPTKNQNVRFDYTLKARGSQENDEGSGDNNSRGLIIAVVVLSLFSFGSIVTIVLLIAVILNRGDGFKMSSIGSKSKSKSESHPQETELTEFSSRSDSKPKDSLMFGSTPSKNHQDLK
eukprot:gb/GECH01000066.1/.p1 GENE.gb/GECH01000066.1/~~gb/GECH01000066.1/.p1  ORF type:complete len:291 (+),score=64.80 gb/GECH01000066.1/:1-873(+)